MGTSKALTILALLAALPSSLARAEDLPIETQAVDALNKAFGVHPGFRANHAKGIVVEGNFEASPQAAGLSKAVLFAGATIPVTVRFSNSTGIPNLPDGSPLAVPQGMAIRYHLPGQLTDGIEQSDDPLIDVRSGAYAEPFSRRSQ